MRWLAITLFSIALVSIIAGTDDNTFVARQKACDLVVPLRDIAKELPLFSNERSLLEKIANLLYLHASYEPKIGDKKSQRQSKKSRKLLIDLQPLMEQLLSLLPKPPKIFFVAEYGAWFEDPKAKEAYRENLLKTYKDNDFRIIPLVRQLCKALEKHAPKLPKEKPKQSPLEPPYFATDKIQHHATMFTLAIQDGRYYYAGYHLGELLKRLRDR